MLVRRVYGGVIADEIGILRWNLCGTQIPSEDADLAVAEQRHTPLAFDSGSFKGAQLRWATSEKEGYALIKLATQHSHILLRAPHFRFLISRSSKFDIIDIHTVCTTLEQLLLKYKLGSFIQSSCTHLSV